MAGTRLVPGARVLLALASARVPATMGRMVRVEAVPCLKDNYAWLITGDGARAVVVDPGESAPVLARLQEKGLTLEAVLLTHHHRDHVDGAEELLRRGARVYSSEVDCPRVGVPSRGLVDGEEWEAAGLRFRCHAVPGHTRGAVCFQVGEHFFTGDTLFTAGCGRLFEGPATELYLSLQRLMERSGPGALFHTGHEYTEQNLLFALSVEPRNAALLSRLAHVREQRSRGAVTATGSLALELGTNPYLRLQSASLRDGLGLSAEVPDQEVFRLLRARRDVFVALPRSP